MLDTEVVVGLVIAAVIFLGPWIMAVVALTKSSALRRDLAALERRLASHLRATKPRIEKVGVAATSADAVQAPAPQTTPTTTQVTPQDAFVPPAAIDVIKPPAPLPAALNTSSPPPLPDPPKQRLELKLGGTAASFIGIATLVIGISYFIVYALQHNWINPAMRIIAGLCMAGLLVAIGWVAERRGRNLAILSRALTGGGVALFYFCVFSAFHFHQLIGSVTCGVGLVACTAVCLTLATLYNSQSIAILGVLGAFLTPMLVDAMDLSTTFILTYIACVNIPVMLLGLRRKWQPLYNLSLALTVVLAFAWIGRNVFGANDPAWGTAVIYCTVYFLEFAALALLKLRGESKTMGRTLDLWRLNIASLLLYAAVFAILTEAGQDAWLAEAYVAAGLLHAALAVIAWRLRPGFREEVLSLTAGAILFITVAVPAELDGTAVSIVWALEGVLLAIFGLRARSALLVEMAAVIGMIGLFKVLFWDLQPMQRESARLFLNSHFFVSLATVLGLGGQAVLHSRGPQDDAPRIQGAGIVLGLGAPLGFLTACWYDLVTLGASDNPWIWNLSSITLLLTGLIALMMYATTRAPCLKRLTWIVLILLPVKMLLADAWLGLHAPRDFALFANYAFCVDLALLCMAACIGAVMGGRPHEESKRSRLNALGALTILAGIAIFWRDIFTLMPSGSDYIWVLSSATLLLGAMASMALGRRPHFSGVRTLSSGLIILTVLKITTLDAAATFDRFEEQAPVFNVLFACQAAMLIAAGFGQWLIRDRERRCLKWRSWALNAFLALVGAITLVTIEFLRVDAQWGSTAITLWWALCGLTLAICGLTQNLAALRYGALALFGMTLCKVFIVDLSALQGLMRIAAFVGVGLLLLLLSYAYQKLAPKLMALWAEDDVAQE